MAASARWTERQSTNIAFIDNHFVRKRKFYYSRLAINFPTENMYSHSHSPLWPSLIFFFSVRLDDGMSADWRPPTNQVMV